MTRPPVAVGDVIHVGEPDYLYGRGPVNLRITQVDAVERHADGLLLQLYGVELGADGREKNARPRGALVRVRALLGRPRPPEAKP